MYAQLLEKHKNQITIFELYVRNFPPNIRQSQVVNFFNRFAKVKSVRVFPPKYSGASFATVRFFDFQTMFNIYLKFAYSQSNKDSIYVEISRTSLLICRKCNKVGHWKNQCTQKLKSRRIQKYNSTQKSFERADFEKSIQQIVQNRQFKSFGKGSSSINWPFSKEQQQEEDISLEYFCSELEEAPKAQSIDRSLNIQQSQINLGRLKNQEEDAATNYEEQSEIIDPFQKEIIFVSIDPSSPQRSLMNPQENSRLQSLWDQGWFHKPPQHIGAFVKIIKTSPSSLNL